MSEPLLGPPTGAAEPAVTVAGRSATGAELWSAAGAVADRVAGAGAVAVHGTPTLSTVVGVLGGVLAGVPVVPVPADAGAAERAHILRDSGAELWLGGRLDGVGLPMLPVDPAGRSAGRHPDPPPDRTAVILYTSGTTGPPKGVVLSRAAVAADLDGLADAWAWTPDDVLVHGLPVFHVHGLVLGVLGALRIGCRLVHTGRPAPAAYAAAASAGGTLFFGVPTVWSRVANEPAAARALRRTRLLVSGSAPLPATVAGRLRAHTGRAPVERYGMTETLITLAARSDQPRRVGWVGTPVPGVQARLRDDAGHPVPADGQSVGELQVRGRTLFDGYLGQPEATAASHTADGWFRTGDAATVDDRGWYRIVGRMSTDLIKSGGYRVGAGEVESSLLDHPAVQDCAVVGVPDADLGQRIVAYVVGHPIDPAELTAFVADRLSVHKRPREIRVVDTLPRNEMGKVQKQLLSGSSGP